METSKKISINFSSLFARANNKSNVDLSSLVVRYKNSKPLNRHSTNLEAYINNCVSLSSYDFNNNLISSNEGYLGYQGNTLCLTLVEINLANILTNLGINYNQISSITLELWSSFSPYYGDIDIYDINDNYIDTIDCTDGHNPLEIDIKAIYDGANNASFVLIPVEPCSGITLFNNANAYLRINYQSDSSYLRIEQPPNKVSYFEGEAFDPTGMVIKLFHNDGSSEVITNYSYSPNSALTTLDTSITITYQNLSINQVITVNSIVLESISIHRAPYKLNYIEGDEFEIYGLILKAHYNNGVSNIIDDYSYSPNRPLNVNDNQITFTYNDKSVVQPIIVSAAPTSGYFPIINNQKASINDNPILNLNDLSTRFISETISVNRDSYALSFNMIYVSNLKDKLSRNIKGLPKRFKTNYNQFLFLDGADGNNNPIYKYLDSGAYTHSFYKINDSLCFSYQTNLFLTIDVDEDDEDIYTIIDDSKNKLVFNSDGYLVQIINGFDNSNIKELTYDDNGYLIEVKDNRDMTSKLSFIYQDNQLINVIFIYQNQVVKSLSFSYDSEGLLTNIHEMANNSFRELYTFIYNTSNVVKHSSYDRVEYIKDHLNSISYHISHIGFNSILKEFATSEIASGYFNSDNHFVKKTVLSVGIFNVRLDDLKTINEVRIRDENNIVTSYNIDILANITATFECVNNEYKTLYKEKGVFVPFNQNIISENGINKYINTHQLINLSLPLSFSLNDDALSLINQYRHFSLRFYLKLNDTSQRIRAFLSGNNISSYPVDINIHQYQRYQLVEIPFSKTIDNHSSLSLTLSFINENNQNANIDIGNIYIDKADKVNLYFNNGSFAFNDIETVSLFASNSPAYFSFSNIGLIYLTEIDLINTLKRVRSHNDIYQEYLISDNLGSILFLNNNQSFIRFKFSFAGYSSNNNFTNYHLSNSSLDDSNVWFIESVSFDNKAKTRTYYRFNNSDYEIIKRNYVKNENNDDYILTLEIVNKYSYQEKLLQATKINTVDDDNNSTVTTYQYFNDGQIKKITQSNGSESIILYEAMLDNNNRIIRKTSDLHSVDIAYDKYLESVITKNAINGSSITNTPYIKEFSYNSYLDDISSVAFKYNNENKGTNNVFYNNLNTTLSVNNSPLYELSYDETNNTSIFKRYNDSSYDNVVSIKETNLINEITFFNDTSNVVITNNYDEHERIINQKLNNEAKVAFNYEDSNESLLVTRFDNINDRYLSNNGLITRYSYDGFDYEKAITFNDYFEIKYLTNGDKEYDFGTEAYVYSSSNSYLEIKCNNLRSEYLSVKYTHDAFNRLSKKERLANTNLSTVLLKDTYSYQFNSNLPSSYAQKDIADHNHIYETYTYDSYGNISSVSTSFNGIVGNLFHPFSAFKQYTYDGFNRIISESNTLLDNLSRTYSYDNQGRMIYFGDDQLSYNNKGQLEYFGNTHFTYDNYGNCLTKGNDNYEWERGKFLRKIIKDGRTISFTYDYLGRRYKKDYYKETVIYFYDDNNKLIGESHQGKTYVENNVSKTHPSFELRFFYNNDNSLNGVRLIYQANNHTINEDYVYIINPFGEIVGLAYEDGAINDTKATLYAAYIYDAWGNHKVLNTLGNESETNAFIGYLNPFRFKGYYYDQETGLYYLLSRYYDSSIGQFISPDGFDYLNINNLSGYQLYAYCNNNPVMNYDPKGHAVISLFSVLIATLIGAAIGTIGGTVNALYGDYKDNGSIDGSLGFKRYLGSIISGAISGAAIGFSGGAGIAWFGPALAGTGSVSTAWIALGVSAGVSYSCGFASYSVDKMVSGDSWSLKNALIHGALTTVEGVFAFGAGGVSSLIKWEGGKIIRIGHKFINIQESLAQNFTSDIFGNPIGWLLDFIMDNYYD